MLILYFCQFGSQEDANLDTFGEAGFLVMPAQCGDCVDDVVQLTERLASQLLIEGFKVRFDLWSVQAVVLAVVGVQHLQDRVGIAVTVVR